MVKKKCTKCLKLKQLTDFNICKANPDGFQFACKTCKKTWYKRHYKVNRAKMIAKTVKYRKEHKEEWLKYSADYRKINKEKIRFKKILKIYNLTQEEYQNIFLNQDQKCAICKKKDFYPAIDHNHITGKVRGILCMNCNSGIGNLGDSIERIEAALNYLKNEDHIAHKKL